MKRVAHLLAYLIRRQFSWVALFWILVATLVACVHWELLNAILLGALGMSALIIVARIHDHLSGGYGEGVLRNRPVEKKHLLVAELVFLFWALILPVMVGIVVVLISYEARVASYTTSLILLAFVTSQVVLWYVAGKLSKSFFGALMLILFHYLPVLFLWAIVEIRNNHASIEVTVFLVLGVVGFLSLLLVVLPFLRRTKVVLFVGIAGVLFFAMSGIEWDRNKAAGVGPDRYREKLLGKPPGPEETISVGFAETPPADADAMKDSHWYFFNISSERTDEIFVPTSFLGSPFTGSREVHYFHYLWQEVRKVMLGDVILRNLPAGTELRGREQNWRSYQAAFASKEAKIVRVREEKEALLFGQKHRLIPVGQLPLKVGSSSAAEGYRASIREVDFRTTKLLVQVQVGWAIDALMKTKRKGFRTAWVLYSPSAQRGVLTTGNMNHPRKGFQTKVIRTYRESLSFPLPETFTEENDLELHVFYLEEGERLKFDVSIPPGEYSVR